MFYSFETTTTLKEKDWDKWWCNNDLVTRIELEANNLSEALEKYRQIVNDKTCVQISENAIQKKEPMYRDCGVGNRSQQVGYVITGSTYFEYENGDLVKKYIDLWVEVRIMTRPSFG